MRSLIISTAYKILFGWSNKEEWDGQGKSEGKRPLGRPRRRWEDNIKVNLQEVRCGAWTGLIWLRMR
jgi:hypothetical protein